MKFDDLFKNAYASVNDMFGEVVTYVKEGALDRKVVAMVDRNVMASDNNGIPVRVLQVHVRQDSTGIDASEIDMVNDIILVDKVRGEEVSPLHIVDFTTGPGNILEITCR